ncbi:DsbA family protein [Nitrospira sp. T9]|uniref:DsbA family protein n=1 Tax=unclassified Nitrospira TaxID=2652172 RepID=UPI003F9C72E4
MNRQIQAIEKPENSSGGTSRLVRGLIGLLVCVGLLMINPGPGRAVVEEDVRALREDMEQVKKDLAEIKSILQSATKRQRPEKSTGTVGVTGGAVLGEVDAPVTIVEFSDYQCPFCRRYSLTVFPVLKREYIDTGKVRYVFRDFPLTSIHQQAEKAHESAHCAGESNKYWEMHDMLFEKQNDLMVPSLKQYAGELGLDSTTFEECLDSGKYQVAIQKDVDDGGAAGIRGTPSFFVGKSGSGDSITGTIIRGAQPLVNFQTIINQLLSDHASDAGVSPESDDRAPVRLP